MENLNKQKSHFTLPDLPYSENALEPHISGKTLSFHYGKHHQTYVNNLNNLIKDTPYADLTLEEIIKKTHNSKDIGVYNNAAQIWNHTFFWHSMKPNGGGQPSAELAQKLIRDFGSVETFIEDFKAAAISQFGSGWAWLVSEGDKLKITKTSNADLPLVFNQKALLTVDVWEHSYYLDYQNRRPDYLTSFGESLINWQFVEDNLNSQTK